MFTIKSYIKIPHKIIDDLKKIQQNPLAYFIDIDNEKEIVKIKKQFDLDYLEGAIYLAFNDQIVMDCAMWDLVDTLWAYLLILIKDVIEKNKAEIYFPDQAIQIKMQADRKHILFSLIISGGENREWRLPRDLFLKALLDGAKCFFEKMTLLFEENQEDYLDELTRIRILEKRLWS
jgi:hypothetical protein